MRSSLTPLLVVAALTLPARPAAAELVDRIVAIVDREVVLLSEAEQARAIARVRSGEEARLAEVVERLIEARLVEREVERFTSDPVPSVVVDEALEEVRSRFGSEADFQEELHRGGLTPAELRSELARQIEVTRYLERRFRALSFVSEEEVETYYRDELPERLGAADAPPLAEVAPLIRQLLEEREFNRRVEEWLGGLLSRSKIKRYVW
jgi:peptidyl-prolyl cis-trans isomerase SurA